MVLVRDGATAVIGGIYQSNEQTSQDSTPFLGKMPILGYLFRNRFVARHEQRAAAVHHAADHQGVRLMKNAGCPCCRSRGGELMKRAALVLVAAALAAVAAGCVPTGRAERDALHPGDREHHQRRTASCRSCRTSTTRTSARFVNDNAIVTVERLPQEQQRRPGPRAPSSDVFLERYEVRYFRTDGRDVEGVDVPFRITGPMGTCASTRSRRATRSRPTAIITIVRHQAKLEPPLRNLRIRRAATAGPSGPAAGDLHDHRGDHHPRPHRQGDVVQAVGRCRHLRGLRRRSTFATTSP